MVCIYGKTLRSDFIYLKKVIRARFWDTLNCVDLIELNCFSVLCGCMMSPTSGIYWVTTTRSLNFNLTSPFGVYE